MQHFLNDLETNLTLEEQASTCISYDKLTKIFKETTDKHAPQKKRKIRGHQAPFMAKELTKKIIKRPSSFGPPQSAILIPNVKIELQ